MISLALIGREISHSKSQAMYEEILNKKIEYTLIDCPNEDSLPQVEELFESYSGVSITAPYKRFYLDKVEVSKEVRSIGAINCLVRSESGIKGINTDYLAAKEILSRLTLENQVAQVVILGDGAMGKMTTLIAEELNLPFVQHSRRVNGDISTVDLSSGHEIRSLQLVINTCSRSFVFAGKLGEDDLFWDFNYDFVPHQYISRENRYLDGLELLKLQATYALKEWKIL